MTTDAIMSLPLFICSFSISQMLSFIIVLCAITLCELICLDSASYPGNLAVVVSFEARDLPPDGAAGVTQQVRELWIPPQQKRHLRGRVEQGEVCVWAGARGPVFLSYSRRGGKAQIYVLSGSCNKTKRVRRCRLGTNTKGSGVWRRGDGAPPEDWMKLSLYNQGASAWLPPPLPADR